MRVALADHLPAGNAASFVAREDAVQTEERFATTLQSQIGGSDFAGIDEFDPTKHKGMRWRTYDRLITKARHLDEIADERTISLKIN